jgi:hypothetical protein
LLGGLTSRNSPPTEKGFPSAAGGLGPGIAQSTFHHLADYNWDVKMGSPSFVSEPPGAALVKSDKARRSVARYVGNLALWFAGRDVNELESTRMKLDRELDEALEETFPASDPPSITREP